MSTMDWMRAERDKAHAAYRNHVSDRAQRGVYGTDDAGRRLSLRGGAFDEALRELPGKAHPAVLLNARIDTLENSHQATVNEQNRLDRDVRVGVLREILACVESGASGSGAASVSPAVILLVVVAVLLATYGS